MKREYEKYEFCKAVGCLAQDLEGGCILSPSGCCYTAQEFHQWLQENGFKIVKEKSDGL